MRLGAHTCVWLPVAACSHCWLLLLEPAWLQVCLVARKGEDPPGMRSGVGSDIIYR